MFTHDKVAHEYRLGGERLRSVTELLAPLVDLSMIPEERLQFAADRGTAIHRATELDDAGDLDESSVDRENVLPYLQAWRRFREDMEVVNVLSEEPMFHPQMLYAGTPDRASFVTISGQRALAVIDLKSIAKMTAVIGVQLTGYALLIEANGYPPIDLLIGVQLKRDGRYRMHLYKREAPMFLSLLTLHNWKARNGI